MAAGVQPVSAAQFSWVFDPGGVRKPRLHGVKGGGTRGGDQLNREPSHSGWTRKRGQATEALIFPAVGMGAVASVSGLANAIPEPVVELFQAVKGEDLERARELQQRVSAMRDVMHMAPTLAMIQAILHRRGVNAGYPRLPFTLPERELVDEAVRRFRNLGVTL